MVDALGNLVTFVLLPGQRHDLIGVPFLLDGVEFEALIADRAYDSNALRDELKERSATAVIPPKSNRVDEIDYDVEMYKWRHLVENFFCKLKHFRRLAMRFEKTKPVLNLIQDQLRRDDSCGEFSLGTRLNVNRP